MHQVDSQLQLFADPTKGLGSADEAVSIVHAWCGSPCKRSARFENSPEVFPSDRTVLFSFLNAVERGLRGFVWGLDCRGKRR